MNESQISRRSQLPLLPIVLIICLVLQMFLLVFLWRDIKVIRHELLALVRANDSSTNAVSRSPCPGLEIGKQIPSLTLHETNGQPISLNDYLGSYLLVVFSTTDCPYCIDLYDDLRSYDQKFRPTNVHLLLVSRASNEENEKLKKEQGFEFPVLNATKEDFNKFPISATPTLILIDEDGNTRACNIVSRVEEIITFVNTYVP
ncbi:MAG: TlpA disulfide reductase family protein [Anaerolineae bacterium]